VTTGAFDGVRVVEYSTMVSGPYCAKLLADMGADVIKVEEPPHGDPARRRGPFPSDQPHPERSGLFLYLNTSKRGITLDPEEPLGRDGLERLIRWADVLVDNHRPERLESLGLGWEAVRTMNRALIVTSITPYGRTGPHSERKGGELTSYHAGGLGNLLPVRSVDVQRAPVKAGGYPVGYHAGLTAALATAAALVGRSGTTRGRLIDISEQEAILALVRTGLASHLYHRIAWSRVPERPPSMGRMPCKDGYVIVGAFEDHHWRGFVELMGNPDWASDPAWDSRKYRAKHLMEIAPLLDEWMSQQSKDDIHHKGAAKGFAIGPVNTAEDVMKYRQYEDRGYFVEVNHPEGGRFRYAGWPYQMSATPPQVQRPAPLLGQHNEEVYRELLGYSEQDFDQLRKAGAV
jgi:crotonobetainyl-CoA:carnitine CoA-transferase CaiB-like acyl-CoA transferase